MKRKIFKSITLTLSAFLISACQPLESSSSSIEEFHGTFFSVDAAFENELLNQDDLKNIAFYYCGASDNDFVASPKNPAALSAETENMIKQRYLSDLKILVPDATLADVYIRSYYGTYGDCVAVKVWDDRIAYDLYFIPEHYIGGVLFTNYCAREIYIFLE